MKVKFTDGLVEQYEDIPLTQGAMGAIYRSQDKKSVVKLYHPSHITDSEHIKRLDIIINELNPAQEEAYWAQFFTWPEKRVIYPSVGYRMPFVSGLKPLSITFFQKRTRD